MKNGEGPGEYELDVGPPFRLNISRFEHYLSKRFTGLQQGDSVPDLQYLRHPHGRGVHDITGEYMAPDRYDAPSLGLPDVRAGAGAVAEYRYFPLDNPDLSAMGARGQRVYTCPKPAQPATRPGCWRYESIENPGPFPERMMMGN